MQDEFENEIRSAPVAVGISILYVVGLAAGLIWCSVADRPLLSLPSPQRLAVELALAALTGLSIVGLVRLVEQRSRALDAILDSFAERLGPMGGGSILAVSCLSAAAEEVFFRGAVQPVLGDLLKSPIGGLLVTSLIFGLLHTGPGREFRPWTIFATLSGLVLGLSFQLTGHILTPFLIHFLINALNLVAIMRRGKGRGIGVMEA